MALQVLFSFFFSATSGGILDRAIEAEDKKHGDFLRLVSFDYSTISLPFPPHAYLSLAFSFLARKQKYTDMFTSVFCHFEQDHVEGYLELSGKTKVYFATAVALWDADFYVKVDDDVHVNIGESLDVMLFFSKFLNLSR